MYKKILLLAAMDKEIDLLLDLLSEVKLYDEGKIKFYRGVIGTNSVFVSKCGIGKVNSALNVSLLIQRIHPDIVINSGVAGGAGTPIGTLLVADKVAYHDVWCGPGTDYGQAEGVPLFMIPSKEILEITESEDLKDKVDKGLICSGDKFISRAEEIAFIRSKFPEVKAVDMESASIAQTCMVYGTPFAILRVVSDTPGDGENLTQYKDFWTTAPEKSFKVLNEILAKL